MDRALVTMQDTQQPQTEQRNDSPRYDFATIITNGGSILAAVTQALRHIMESANKSPIKYS